MEKGRESKETMPTRPLHVGLAFILFLAASLRLMAQEPVSPVRHWVATVDDSSQHIVLRWDAGSESDIMGYHICTGTPCLDYDTVFGRQDTTYVCYNHSPLEQHTYRIHVFDSAYNVSALTPAFGNMVLQAEVPECATRITARWTPYRGIPSGIPHYTLQVRLEPFDADYVNFYNTSDSTGLEHSFEIVESVTRAWLRVRATGEEGFHSLSNTVMVERLTVDSASVVEIAGCEYDSIHRAVLLTFHTDPDFHYTLYRSVDGSPWRKVDDFDGATTSYADRNIDVYDSLHCYQLGVLDACGMNEHYSPTTCVVVPAPPPPSIYLPNAIILSDETNGTFRPVVRGLMGDLYELDIYNRSGVAVFHTDDQFEGWTPEPGTPLGAYTYRLRCRFNTGDIKTYSGTVTLIK